MTLFKNRGQTQKLIRTIEKGAPETFYHISRQGIEAIQDYLNEERQHDDEHFSSLALLLPYYLGSYQGPFKIVNLIFIDSGCWEEFCF